MKYVRNVSYISHIGYVALNEGQYFTGLTEITFELISLLKILPLDFVCYDLEEIIINGSRVVPDIKG